MTTAPVFVTGGTGFVGGAVVRQLVAAGRRVVGLARSDVGAERLQRLGAHAVRGDILDAAGLPPLLQGSEVVYHVAGVNAFCLSDPSPMFRANVDGSVNVVRAAARAGVRRIVYTSSAAAIGEARGTVGREDSPHRGYYLSDYERSKHAAEEAALDAAAELGIEAVAVNPSSVQGPGRSEGTGKLFIAFLRGRLRTMVRTHISIVDIDDCARGHVLAEARGRAGRRYLLSGAALTVEEALATVGRVAGIERRTITLPDAFALAGARAAEIVAAARRRRPSVCTETVRTLLHGHSYDGSRAERELGLRYTPVEDTLRAAIDWYARRGLVPAPR